MPNILYFLANFEMPKRSKSTYLTAVISRLIISLESKKGRKDGEDSENEHGTQSGAQTPVSRQSQGSGIQSPYSQDLEGSGLEDVHPNQLASMLNPYINIIGEQVDLLSEKRTPIREAALKNLVGVLGSKYSESLLEAVEKYQETQWMYLLRITKRRQSELEMEQAVRLMGLYILLVSARPAAVDEDMYKQASEAIGQVLKSSNQNDGNIKCHTVSTLSIAAVVGCGSSLPTLQLVGNLIHLLRQPSSSETVLEATLLALCFVWSMYPTCGLSTQEQSSQVVSAILTLLSNSNVNVRIAAGQTLVLMAELALSHSLSTIKEQITDHVGEIKEKMAELSQLGQAQSVRKIAKKDRSSQKSAFRDLESALESFPERVQFDNYQVQFKQSFVEVEDWTTHCILQFLTAVLGDGVSVWVSSGHETLREWLGAEGEITVEGEQSEPARQKRSVAGDRSFEKRELKRGIDRDRGSKRSQRDVWLNQ